MKPFEQQTYYELLELPVSAPVDDIRAAYSRLMELYSPDSIAVYALVEPEQVDTLRARMTEAMEILTDEELRAEYDKDLGLPALRMVEAVAAGGKPSAEATPGEGAVARVAEALAGTAVDVSAQAQVSESGTQKEPARAAVAEPAPEEPAVEEVEPAPEEPPSAPVGPGDFRATFFRGFSFAYVSSSIQTSQLVGSVVDVPSAVPAPGGTVADAAAATSSPASEVAPAVPTQEGASPVAQASPVAPAEAAPSVDSRPEEPPASAPAAPIEPTPPATATSPVPATAASEPAPASHAFATVPARQEGASVPAPQTVPPPLPGTRAAVLRATAEAQAAARAASPESERAPQRPATGRQLGDAQVLAQDSAIATAEAALAQVAARVREPRPRTPDIPADAEFNGELLRRVREARGFTLQQVADRTRISRSHLENVEADRYAALPPPVYLRGILMNLARELGLDPLRVSRSYLALASEKSGKK